MSRIFACILFLFAGSVSFSQKAYFIYIQSETSDPFFVKMGEKTFSSAAGFLILSELKDSSYQLRIGFSQNKWPDQQFVVAVKSKDHGYLLKNFGEKGWGLFDLQTLAVQMAAQANAGFKHKELRDVSEFTSVLSKAANDPSLLYKPEFAVAKSEPITPATNKAVPDTPARESAVSKLPADTATFVKSAPPAENENVPAETATVSVKDSAITETVSPKETAKVPHASESTNTGMRVEPPAASSPSAQTPETTVQFSRSKVTKRSESSTTDGFGLTFIDQSGTGEIDTVQILIPNPPANLSAKASQPDARKFLDITDEEKDGRVLGAKPLAKSACNTMGTESDFLKLRKKMAGQKTEDAMIEEAKKGFRSRCYSTEQIRNLGNLFLKEAGKFQFYEAVYPYSADRDKFVVLQTEFKDNYFIHRFRNLVNQGNL